MSLCHDMASYRGWHHGYVLAMLSAPGTQCDPLIMESRCGLPVPRATEAPTFQLLTIISPVPPPQVEQEPSRLPTPVVLHQSNRFTTAPSSRLLTHIAASFIMSATWVSKRGMFALLGAGALVFLLAGHYTYTNSMGGKPCPFRLAINEVLELTCLTAQETFQFSTVHHPMPRRLKIFFHNRFPIKSGKVGRMIRKTRPRKQRDCHISGAQSTPAGDTNVSRTITWTPTSASALKAGPSTFSPAYTTQS